MEDHRGYDLYTLWTSIFSVALCGLLFALITWQFWFQSDNFKREPGTVKFDR